MQQEKQNTERKVLRAGNLTYRIPKVNTLKIEVPNFWKFNFYLKDDLPKNKRGLIRRGIYALILKDFIIYIGMSRNFPDRIKQQKRYVNFDSYLFFHITEDNWLELYGKILIIKYKPILNKELYTIDGRNKL